MMINPYFLAPASALPANLTYHTNAVDAVDRTVYTYAAVAIGTAAADRQVIIGVSDFNGSTVTGVTVGGISASILAASYYSAGSQLVTMWIANVPTDTTADVVVTHGTTIAQCGIGVWTVNAASYSIQVVEMAAYTALGTITHTFANVKNNDVIISIGRCRSANIAVVNYTAPAVENFAVIVESGVTAMFGGVSTITADAASYNHVLTNTGSSRVWLSAAVRFRRLS